MFEIFCAPEFEKQYRMLAGGIQKQTKELVNILQKKPQALRRRIWPLKGEFNGLWAIAIGRFYSLIFEFLTPNRVYLHWIGRRDLFRPLSNVKYSAKAGG